MLGVGKTTLARQHWRQLQRQQPMARLRWLDAQGLCSQEQLLEALGQLLGGAPGQDVGALLAQEGITHLALDHPEAALPWLRQLLPLWRRQAPDTCFLIITRRRLGLPWERLVELPPLETPATPPASAQLALEHRALQLWEQRAALVVPGYRLEERPWQAVCRIAHKLDGIPLALELAAQSLHLLDEASLERHLEQPGWLLQQTTGDRGQTLAQRMRGTWESLSATQRQVLARCSLLQSCFDVDIARAVLALEGVELLAELTSLRDRSLLVLVEQGAQPWVKLPLLWRWFCAQELDPALRDQLQRRLATWAARCLHQGDFHPLRFLPPLPPKRLERLRPLLLQAATAALDSDWPDAAELAARCLFSLERRGAPPDNYPRFVSLLERCLERWRQQERGESPMALLLRFTLGRLKHRLRYHEDALAYMQGVLRSAQQQGLLELASAAASTEALIHARLHGPQERALELLQQGVALALQARCPLALAHARRRLANHLHLSLGQLEQAEPHYLEALDAARSQGQTLQEAYCLTDLGNLYRILGRSTQAQAHMSMALELLTTQNHRVASAQTAVFLSHLTACAGDPEASLRWLEQALGCYTALEMPIRQVDVLLTRADMLLAFRRLEDCQRDLQAAQALLDRHPRPWQRVWLSLERARLAWWRQLPRDAMVQLDVARSLLQQHPGWHIFHLYQSGLRASLHALGGQHEEAQACLQQVQERAALVHDPIYRAWGQLMQCHAWVGQSASLYQHLPTIRQRLLQVWRPHQGGDSLVERSLDLREAVDGLLWVMPAEVSRLLLIERSDPEQRGLVINREGLWFRAPGQDMIYLHDRPKLAQLLATLVQHREQAPGSSLSNLQLRDLIWPGEKILPRAAQNRLYVAVSSLRKAGLDSLVQRSRAGYRLDPEVPLHGSDASLRNLPTELI